MAKKLVLFMTSSNGTSDILRHRGERGCEVMRTLASRRHPTWFVNIVLEAQIQAEELIDFTLMKTRLFDRFKDQLNERQLQTLRRMLEESIKGFEGGISAKKYMTITGASKATATRDL